MNFREISVKNNPLDFGVGVGDKSNNVITLDNEVSDNFSELNFRFGYHPMSTLLSG